MTTIWMNPTELEATATAINGHLTEVRNAVEPLAGACACAMPPALADWCEHELADIAQDAGQWVLSCCIEALGLALRAHEIDTDQSLVAATPALAVAEASQLAGGPASWLTDMANKSNLPSAIDTSAWTAEMGHGSAATVASPLGLPAPTVGLLRQSDVIGSLGEERRSIVQPGDITVHGGLYVDARGDGGNGFFYNSATGHNEVY